MASIRWVRPDLTTDFHSRLFLRKALARWSSAGISSLTIPLVAAMWIAEGNMSLDDSGLLT